MNLLPVTCSGCGIQLGVSPFNAGRTMYCDAYCEKASWAKDPGERAALLALGGKFDFLVSRNAERDSLIIGLSTTSRSSREIGSIFNISGTRVRQICAGK